MCVKVVGKEVEVSHVSSMAGDASKEMVLKAGSSETTLATPYLSFFYNRCLTKDWCVASGNILNKRRWPDSLHPFGCLINCRKFHCHYKRFAEAKSFLQGACPCLSPTTSLNTCHGLRNHMHTKTFTKCEA